MLYLELLGFEVIFMDDFIDELLREERVCDVILPRLQVSFVLAKNFQRVAFDLTINFTEEACLRGSK